MPEPDANRWFNQEVQPHEPALRRWLGARFPSLTDRDDIVQESFARVLRARINSPIANARAFLFATARHLALNHLRHRGYRHPEGLGEIDASSVIDEQADTPEAVARHQELELLRESIQSLPERCRQVFTLRRIHGLSQKETAARLGISEKTVENHSLIALQRCVEFFRDHDALAANEGRRSPTRRLPASVQPFPNPGVRHA